nr:hypothetical protein CFP56_42047 [Quercus suber]
MTFSSEQIRISALTSAKCSMTLQVPDHYLLTSGQMLLIPTFVKRSDCIAQRNFLSNRYPAHHSRSILALLSLLQNRWSCIVYGCVLCGWEVKNSSIMPFNSVAVRVITHSCCFLLGAVERSWRMF